VDDDPYGTAVRLRGWAFPEVGGYTMTEDRIELTRRKILAGAGAVGIAGAGAGLGTSAFFSDTETFTNNQLTAGSLDLKVDWEEHYSDWSQDEADAVSDVQMVENQNPDNVQEGYVGLPDPAAPLIAVPDEDLASFMDATSVEAYPDEDDDGIQDDFSEENPCTYLADVGGDSTGLDSDRRTESSRGDPLVDLQDVKPGDFGELTLSFHICDNPGYVWLNADNVSESENEQTEPEAEVDNSPGGELAENIQTAWWYDDGDNVLRNPCDRAPETLYMTDSGTDPTTLFSVDLVDDGNGNPLRAELTQLWPDNGGDGDFEQTDAIAATPDGEEVYFYDKISGHLGVYDVTADSFSDLGPVSGDPGGVVLAAFSPAGTLWVASQFTDELDTVDVSGPSVTSQGDTGISLQGADIAFAADGSLFVWTSESSEEGLYKVADPSTDTTAVPVDSSNVGSMPESVTGLAIRDAGTGPLVGSERENDEVVVIDKSDGTIGDRYPMTLNGSSYEYDFGDMTVGALCEQVFRRGTLAEDLEALSAGQGIPLDGDLATDFDELAGDDAAAARECFEPETSHYVGFAWWVPPEVGNEIQTDSVSFDLGFYTEQCRHNDGSGVTPADAD
jgi:predicted ribosomally synthesized peptide with SipW-like signal peptide